MMREFYVFRVAVDIEPLALEAKLNQYGRDGWSIAHIDMATGWVVMVRSK